MVMVSVVVPVYNAEMYIKDCLDSVLSQTMNDLEIICVDDGSTDGSRVILHTYQHTDARVKVLFQKNQGSGPARNNGIKQAQGKYIAFLDSDDFWHDNQVLEKIVRAAEENNSIVTGAFWGSVRNGKYQRSELHREYFLEGVSGRWIAFEEEQDCMGYCSYLFRRDFLVNHNILFPEYYRFQDPPFLAEVLIKVQDYYVLSLDWHCYRTIYKDPLSSIQKTNDFVRGVIDVLELAKEHHLEKLSKEMVRQINEFSQNIINSILLGNVEMFCLLGQIQSYISEKKEEIEPVKFLQTAMQEKCEKIADNFQSQMKSMDKIVIYGAGKYGHFLLGWIKKAGIKKEVVFAETECLEKKIDNGIECVQIDQLSVDSEKMLVVIAVTPNTQLHMEENLKRLGFENYMSLNRDLMTALEYMSQKPQYS